MDYELLEHFMERWKENSIRNALISISVCCILYRILTVSLKWLKNRKKLPPGPIGFPLVGSLPLLGSEPHVTLFNWRKKYGDVIGLHLGRRYTVFLNEYSMMKEVLSNPSSLDRAVEIFDYIPEFGFGNVNRKIWVEQRKFSMSTIKDLGVGKVYWEEVVKEEVQSFLDFLKEAKGKPIEISDTLQISISSNIISFLIGRNLDKKKEANVIDLSLQFNHVIFQFATIAGFAAIPGLRKVFEVLKIGGYDKGAKVLRDFSAFVKKEILGHKNFMAESARDFMGVYLEELEKLKKSGKFSHSFSESMLEGNVIALFSGASDTIFGSLMWLMRLMAEHKDIQQKVYEELTQSLEKHERARMEERDKIPFTSAVIMEGQRFSGFVPLTAPRNAIDDIVVQGFTIPKGADIVTNLWSIHHDPKYWEQPEKFMPERFLTENGTKLLKSPPGYAPFSIGRRNCPGERIAWMEILIYFSEIIRHFEVSTPPGVKPDFTVTKGSLITNVVPQELCFIERTGC